MFVKACNLPNGPIDLSHACLTGIQAGHALRQVASNSLLSRLHHHDISTFFHRNFHIVQQLQGWVPFFLLLAAALVLFFVYRQQERHWRRQAWSLMWRLTSAADQWRAMYEEKRDELIDEKFCQGEKPAAINCGETFILDSEDVGREMAHSCAAALNGRMDLNNPPRWMRWNTPGNSALFAVRSWGGLVWRSLNKHIVEVISIGSCGLAAGAAMVDRMVQRVKQGRFKYIVLKSLSATESFWAQVGFVKLRGVDSQGWWDCCDNQTQSLLQDYVHGAGRLMPFGKRLEAGAEAEQEQLLV